MKTVSTIVSIIAIILGLSSCSDEDSFRAEKEDVLPVRTIENVSARKILNNHFVMSIAFDKNGDAWIGTFKQGVIKYNEQKTVHFNSSNSPFSDDMVINCITVDSKDNVWIGSDGLIKYDGKNFSLYNSENSPIPEDFVHSINIDAQENIWFASSRFQSGGVVKFDGISTWKIFTRDNSTMPGDLVSDIAIAGNDVWIGLNNSVNNTRLVKLTNDKITEYSEEQFGFKPYYLGNLCTDSHNLLYTVNSFLLSSMIQNGPHLFTFDGETTRTITSPLGDIRHISIDSKDNVWCMLHCNRTILVYNKVEWLAVNIPEEDNDNSIFCIEEAPDGKIWVGTGKGIYIIEAL